MQAQLTQEGLGELTWAANVLGVCLQDPIHPSSPNSWYFTETQAKCQL